MEANAAILTLSKLREYSNGHDTSSQIILPLILSACAATFRNEGLNAATDADAFTPICVPNDLYHGPVLDVDLPGGMTTVYSAAFVILNIITLVTQIPGIVLLLLTPSRGMDEATMEASDELTAWSRDRDTTSSSRCSFIDGEA